MSETTRENTGKKLKSLTYADAGVSRKLRKKSKSHLDVLRATHKESYYGQIIKLPYGNLIPCDYTGKIYMDHKIEGIGTKVLVAQLAGRHKTMPMEGLMMAENDVVRSGARPHSAADNVDAAKSDPKFVGQLMRGFAEAGRVGKVPIVDGEIADVPALIKGIREGSGYHIVCSCVGFVNNEDIIRGTHLKAGDVILGLRSSGVHSNGISLVRKVLFKEWGGYYDDPFATVKGLNRDLISEVLLPTVSYAGAVLRVNDNLTVKAAVHITGDSYTKFDKLLEVNEGIGFEFSKLRPQRIFSVIQQTATKLGRVITDDEMLRTFNMGTGFAIVVDKEDAATALEILKQSGMEAWKVGKVTSNAGAITVDYKGRNIPLIRK